jgi:hypothetical protein
MAFGLTPNPLKGAFADAQFDWAQHSKAPFRGLGMYALCSTEFSV